MVDQRALVGTGKVYMRRNVFARAGPGVPLRRRFGAVKSLSFRKRPSMGSRLAGNSPEPAHCRRRPLRHGRHGDLR